MVDRPDKVIVTVETLKHDLHLSLKQALFDKVLGLLAERLDYVLLVWDILAYSGSFDARDKESNVLVGPIGKEESDTES